jgi:hypothetical protein
MRRREVSHTPFLMPSMVVPWSSAVENGVVPPGLLSCQYWGYLPTFGDLTLEYGAKAGPGKRASGWKNLKYTALMRTVENA